MTIETKRIRSYGCCVCQNRHYDGEPLFREHISQQSKHGMSYDLPLTADQVAQRDLAIIRRLLRENEQLRRRCDGLRSLEATAPGPDDDDRLTDQEYARGCAIDDEGRYRDR